MGIACRQSQESTSHTSAVGCTRASHGSSLLPTLTTTHILHHHTCYHEKASTYFHVYFYVRSTFAFVASVSYVHFIAGDVGEERIRSYS